MIRYLPVELILYISRILRNRKLFKIREKLDMDGVFHRHIVLVKYISKSKFYREPWKHSTSLCFRQDPIPDRSQVIQSTIDLKTFRKTMAEIKGKVCCYF